MTETITHAVMTMNEMEKQYDGEWVLLEDPYRNDGNRVAGGKLLFHSPNREEVYQAALRLRPKHGAFLFMGPMPDEIFLFPEKYTTNS